MMATDANYDLERMLPGVLGLMVTGGICQSCWRKTSDPVAGHDGYCPVPALFKMREAMIALSDEIKAEGDREESNRIAWMGKGNPSDLQGRFYSWSRFCLNVSERMGRLSAYDSPASPNAESYEQFVIAHTQWADATFPAQTVEGVIAHLKREAQEVINAETPEAIIAECADVFMMAVRLCAMTGGDLLKQAWAKLQINKARKWGDLDAEGVPQRERSQQ